MVRQIIKEMGWKIIVDHPAESQSRKKMCEFLANLNGLRMLFYLRGRCYTVTPKLIAEVLGLEKVMWRVLRIRVVNLLKRLISEHWLNNFVGLRGQYGKRWVEVL